MSFMINAADLARERGIDPKRFRAKLRQSGLSWHDHNDRWTVEHGSDRHHAIMAVLEGLTKGGAISVRETAIPARQAQVTTRDTSDECYIIDLCDSLLEQSAHRQHRFEFLRGDSGRELPVDAWYPELEIVIEYRERQHSETVAFFDRRQTVSGVGRGEQRRIYDQRRREILPKHSITLVELDFSEFPHKSNRRLIRTTDDKEIIAKRLAAFLK